MRTASDRVSAKIAQIGRAAIQLPGRVRSKTQLQRYHTTKTHCRSANDLLMIHVMVSQKSSK
jgi:hypothetical protein